MRTRPTHRPERRANHRRQRNMLIAGPLIGITLAAGAWSSGQAAEGKAGSDGESPALTYTRCMGDHGIDYPDPVVLNGQLDNGRLPDEFDLESPAFKAAEKACDPRRLATTTGANEDREAIEADMQAALALAACMRDQGINLPDPVLEGGSISGPAGPFDNDWDSFNDAKRICESDGDPTTP